VIRAALIAIALASCVDVDAPSSYADRVCAEYPLGDPPRVADPESTTLRVTIDGDDETPPFLAAVLRAGELGRLRDELAVARTWMREAGSMVARCRVAIGAAP
jgi:hypothetical protein